jgi:hypothetical protein
MKEEAVEKLERVIKAIVAKNLKAVQTGKVTKVDIDKRVCDVELKPDVTLFNCRLNAVTDSYDNHIVIVPKRDSYVAITAIDNQDTNAMVVACSDIEQVIVTVGESKIEVKEDEIIFNGGELKGMVKIEELQKRLKALEKAFNDHTHVATTTATVGTGAVGAVTVNPIAKVSSEFQTQTSHPYNYENDKIKH